MENQEKWDRKLCEERDFTTNTLKPQQFNNKRNEELDSRVIETFFFHLYLT